MLFPAVLVAVMGIGMTAVALRMLRQSAGRERQEVTGLMLFSFGWQLTAVFSGLVLLSLLPLPNAVMATSSALSHFGLFAALQGGMFGAEAAGMIAFVFAMPFLVHPLVFFLFGRAIENNGDMPRIPAYILAVIGVVGCFLECLCCRGPHWQSNPWSEDLSGAQARCASTRSAHHWPITGPSLAG